MREEGKYRKKGRKGGSRRVEKGGRSFLVGIGGARNRRGGIGGEEYEGEE